MRLAPAARPRAFLATSAVIAGAALAAVAAVAVCVALAAAPAARRWLQFPFTGIPATPAEAAGILAHNLRALGGIAGLTLIAQLHWRDDVRGRALPALRTAGECLVAGLTAANVLVVGTALGAYGARMARAMTPHAPVELAAYALALALYVHARERPLAIAEAGTVLGTCAALLAVAAALEVFAAP